MSDAARRWRDDLDSWAIPPEILAAAPESPWACPPGLFGRAAEDAVAAGGARTEDVSRLQLALGRARWAAGDSDGALAAYDKAIRWLADPQTGEGVRAVAAAAEARMLGGRYGESRRPNDAQSAELRFLIERHREYTGSALAAALLADWEATIRSFWWVAPVDEVTRVERAHEGMLGASA